MEPLSDDQPAGPSIADRVLAWAEQVMGLELTPWQQDFIRRYYADDKLTIAQRARRAGLTTLRRAIADYEQAHADGDKPAPVCPKCLGDKQIADTEDAEPWSAWANLPPGSDLAVRMGIVKPIDCPECKGTGVKS